MRLRISSRTPTAAKTWGPLFSMTHSARSPIAASVISDRDGIPFFERLSRTCVAQTTGTWAASQIHNFFLNLRKAFVAAFNGEVTTSNHHPDLSHCHRSSNQPNGSPSGRQRTTAGPDSIAPVRSLGPAMSISMLQKRPVSLIACLRLRIIANRV
jgi:hypothetical protein